MIVLEAGDGVPPLTPTTDTWYWVAGVRPVKSASGVGLVTTTGEPPLSGVAVKMYCKAGSEGGRGRGRGRSGQGQQPSTLRCF